MQSIVVPTGKPTAEENATNARTQWATINGKSIAYRSIGHGDPIIFCQRFRGNLDDWDPAFLDAVARNNHSHPRNIW